MRSPHMLASRQFPLRRLFCCSRFRRAIMRLRFLRGPCVLIGWSHRDDVRQALRRGHVKSISDIKQRHPPHEHAIFARHSAGTANSVPLSSRRAFRIFTLPKVFAAGNRDGHTNFKTTPPTPSDGVHTHIHTERKQATSCLPTITSPEIQSLFHKAHGGPNAHMGPTLNAAGIVLPACHIHKYALTLSGIHPHVTVFTFRFHSSFFSTQLLSTPFSSLLTHLPLNAPPSLSAHCSSKPSRTAGIYTFQSTHPFPLICRDSKCVNVSFVSGQGQNRALRSVYGHATAVT